MLLAAVMGLFTNPYAGLVVFVALPALFILGLLLIPAGIWLQRRALRRDPSAVVDWPVVDLRKRHVRRAVLVVTALTAVNLVIVLLAGYGSLHWMESPGLLRPDVPHAHAPAVHGVAELAALARGVYAVPYR